MESGHRILIAEDDELFRKTLSDIIRRAGYQPVGAGSGRLALAMALEDAPLAVALVDLRLGDMSGLEVIEGLGAKDLGIECILLTGYASKESAIKATNLGVFGYLQKPFDFDQLLLMIRRAVEKSVAKSELADSEARFRGAFLQATFGMALVSVGGEFLQVNRAFCNMLKRPEEELLTGLLADVFAPQERKAETAALQRVLGQSVMWRGEEKRLVRGSQETIWTSVSSELISSSGQDIPYFIFQFQDISDLKHTQDLLVKSERYQAIADLAAGVAHNFRNLLQGILGGLRLASLEIDDGDSDAALEEVNRVIENLRFGSDIVKRLQHYASLRPEDAVDAQKIFDLSETTRQAISISRPWWKIDPRERGVVVSFREELEPDCLVLGDEGQLFEVLINLIKNAAEAVPDGGAIGIDAQSTGDHVVVRVEDNGMGIASCNLSRLFEPFFTTKGFQRSGLGLASSHGIVQRHGGELSVESVEGEGSVFSLRLPLATRG